MSDTFHQKYHDVRLELLTLAITDGGRAGSPITIFYSSFETFEFSWSLLQASPL